MLLLKLWINACAFFPALLLKPLGETGGGLSREKIDTF